jgi:hypothetical protein
MISTGKTPDSSTRALWQSKQRSHLVANQEELGERNDKFGFTKYYVCSHFEGMFTCRSILRHEVEVFYFPCVLLIFIALGRY